ncbi:hypothetical protein L917_07902 [Phytophthora nicotianae]|nr:hypothetical protein L917_07902 [Phytophthora nicotianae]ETM47319.1 hypothetical protein L914_07965 [Phytophthora nicotianae]
MNPHKMDHQLSKGYTGHPTFNHHGAPLRRTYWYAVADTSLWFLYVTSMACRQ